MQKLLFVGSCFLAVDAQLIPPTAQEVHDFINSGSTAEATIADDNVEEGFTNPTICDPNVKQIAGRLSTGNASHQNISFGCLNQNPIQPLTRF